MNRSTVYLIAITGSALACLLVLGITAKLMGY